MNRPIRPRRRAYALVEMLAVISIMALLLGLCVGMIHLLMKLDRSSRSAADEASDLARLARDFRGDAHASTLAGSKRIAADRFGFDAPDGRSVEYVARDLDVVRTVREGDKVKHLDIYRRPSKTSIRFDRAGEAPVFASIVIDRIAGSTEGGPYRDYRVDAAVGRDRRFDRRPE